MGWFAFSYRIGDRPEEHELEEFPGAGDAQRYAAQSLALMLEDTEGHVGSVAVGAAADAHVNWLGIYEAEPRVLPRWRPAVRLA